jgi:hypothetical protein
MKEEMLSSFLPQFLGETKLHKICKETPPNLKELESLLRNGHPVDIQDHTGWNLKNRDILKPRLSTSYVLKINNYN